MKRVNLERLVATQGDVVVTHNGVVVVDSEEGKTGMKKVDKGANYKNKE